MNWPWVRAMICLATARGFAPTVTPRISSAFMSSAVTTGRARVAASIRSTVRATISSTATGSNTPMPNRPGAPSGNCAANCS